MCHKKRLQVPSPQRDGKTTSGRWEAKVLPVFGWTGCQCGITLAAQDCLGSTTHTATCSSMLRIRIRIKDCKLTEMSSLVNRVQCARLSACTVPKADTLLMLWQYLHHTRAVSAIKGKDRENWSLLKGQNHLVSFEKKGREAWSLLKGQKKIGIFWKGRKTWYLLKLSRTFVWILPLAFEALNILKILRHPLCARSKEVINICNILIVSIFVACACWIVREQCKRIRTRNISRCQKKPHVAHTIVESKIEHTTHQQRNQLTWILLPMFCMGWIYRPSIPGGARCGQYIEVQSTRNTRPTEAQSNAQQKPKECQQKRLVRTIGPVWRRHLSWIHLPPLKNKNK